MPLCFYLDLVLCKILFYLHYTGVRGDVISEVETMVSLRHVSGKRDSRNSLVLQLGGDTNNRKRNNNELSVMTDKVKLLCICYFGYRCCFVSLLFFSLVYAHDISLLDFFRFTYVHSTYFSILKTTIKETLVTFYFR